MIPVEGHNNLYRDEKTGAILSTTQMDIQIICHKKKNSDKQSELDTMKREIEELKLMLNGLLQR
ncbi:MAG: hypothetical protein CM15mP113_2280 [Pseudomonadota bacterium]|nr:MAG: hypothetical protein CM15mP113_2280 [Pseudomonadota bacterium]